jgi:hypothetical protein
MRTGRYRFTEWLNAEGGREDVELYDHERDPNETRNLAGHAAHRQLVAELTRTPESGLAGRTPGWGPSVRRPMTMAPCQGFCFYRPLLADAKLPSRRARENLGLRWVSGVVWRNPPFGGY